jgi:hypothetical protein
METKFKIVETEKYTLAVSDGEIKEGEICNYGKSLFLLESILHKSGPFRHLNPKIKIQGRFLPDMTIGKFDSMTPLKKIIGYKPKGNASELDLPLLPDVEDEVERLAKKYINDTLRDEESDDHFLGRMKGFKDCYKSATKKYSEDDLRKAIEMARVKDWQKDSNGDNFWEHSRDEIIQSLKQPKWFVAELEYYYHSSKEFYSDAGFVKCTKEQYESIKSEIPTCPLKIELKTIDINNKIYLEGTYLN